MSIRIAQASSSENYTKYGVSPNQRRTGVTASKPYGNLDGELNIINFKAPWEVVYRPIDSGLADRIAEFCYRAVCNGSHIGYSWNGNTGLFDALKAKGSTNPLDVDTLVNTDCAALVGAAIYYSGLHLDGLRTLTTAKMDTVLMGSKAFNKLTSKELCQQGKGLCRGDLLWRSGHTGCVLDTDTDYRVSLTGSGLTFMDSNGKTTGNYPNNIKMNSLFYFQKFTFNDVSISAGTAGTRAAQMSKDIGKSGYRPVVARLASVSNSALCNVTPFIGGGSENKLYVNYYRASGGSGKIDATVMVIYVLDKVVTS